MNVPFTEVADGLRVAVRLNPRASRAGVAGVGTDAAGEAYLKVRVNAPPEGGKANAALIRLLAKAWGVAPSRVTLAAGAKDRRKTVHVEGEAAELAALLTRWIETRNA